MTTRSLWQINSFLNATLTVTQLDVGVLSTQRNLPEVRLMCSDIPVPRCTVSTNTE